MGETVDKILPHGAEIHFTDDRDPFPANRVVVLESGWVEAINEASYEVELLPPHRIEGMYTHTTDQQEENFNTKDIPPTRDRSLGDIGDTSVTLTAEGDNADVVADVLSAKVESTFAAVKSQLENAGDDDA